MRVLICGLLKIPAGDAGSIRQCRLAVMLREMGNDVTVVGLGAANGRKPQVWNGIRCISLRQGGARFADKAASHLKYWGRLKSILSEYHPDAVLMDDIGPFRTVKLKRYCRKHGVKLVHDSVEWYSPEQFQYGKLSRRYIKKDVLNRFLVDKQCGVIAISRYLERHFLQKGCACVRIPIVITPEDLCAQKELPADKVVFTYAGQPGKKDYLHVMLEALALLPQEALKKVVFHIAGCTKEQMLAAGIDGALLQKMQPHLQIHGRISHIEVLQLLRETHFTLLMRSLTQRYAQAGFPTKVVESLSRSTPVICNLTSDLDMYLTDGRDALIVDGCSAEKLKVQLTRAVEMTPQQREEMCQNALACAEKHFLYTGFLTKMQEILTSENR